MTTHDLSDYLACEAADSGHGVSFLVALTGESEAVCRGALERAEDRRLVYTLDGHLWLLDEEGKAVLKEHRLAVNADLQRDVATTRAQMDRAKREAEEAGRIAAEDRRQWWRHLDGLNALPLTAGRPRKWPMAGASETPAEARAPLRG